MPPHFEECGHNRIASFRSLASLSGPPLLVGNACYISGKRTGLTEDAGNICEHTACHKSIPSRVLRVPGLAVSDGEEVVGRVGCGQVVFVTQVQDTQLASGADLASESLRCPHSHQDQPPNRPAAVRPAIAAVGQWWLRRSGSTRSVACRP